MNYFSLKNLVTLVIVLVVITLSLGISHSLGKNGQSINIFPKYKDVYSDNFKISTNNLTQGDDLNVSFTVYNMSDKEKEVSAGVFLINVSKNYNGNNVDYMTQKQQVIIKPKDKKNFSWKVPVYLGSGNYKMLYWIHQITDGNETVLEDNWYQQEITINEGSAIDVIHGEESNADQGFVLRDLSITPKHLQTGQKLSLTLSINNYGDQADEIISGVYLLEKSKNYDSNNLDQILQNQKATIMGGERLFFKYDEMISLKPGEYRVLIWLHRLKQGKEEMVFDYWAPGNIIVGE